MLFMRDDTYKIILDHSLAGLWDWDIVNDVIYLSPSFKAMLGYAEDDLTPTPEDCLSLMHPEDRIVFLEHISSRVISDPEHPENMLVRYHHKNGSIVWVNCVFSVIDNDSNRKPLRVVGIHINVTLQKEAEHQLRKNKELINKTNMSVKLGGWEIDVLSNRAEWTRITKRLYGVPFEYQPMPYEICTLYKKPEHRALITNAVNRALKTGEGFDYDVVMLTADGREVWVRVTGHAEFQDGRCVKLFGILQDIDDSQRTRQSLKRSEDRFKKAFENSPIGMALVSPDGRWLKVNQGLLSSLGYTAQELMQRTFQDITHPDDLHTDLEYVGQLLRGEIHHYQMEKRYFHKNGSIIWALLSVSLVRDDDGEPIHFVSQIQDITEKKLKDEQIIASLDLVQKQNDRLLNFAYIVSHNLRTHAGNFQSLINLVNDPTTEPEEKEYYLKLLQTVSVQLDETILNLNDVVSIQTNTNLKKVPVSLDEYINKTLNVLTGDIERYDVLIDNRVKPGTEVNYHPAYLESILLNFVTNSIRYRNNNTRPEIHIDFERMGEGGILSISDNGIGIDMKRHGENLFGMYKTFHGNKDAKGVGLFITKNQIESMGGRIEVQSEVNKGTMFKVYFN